MYDLGEQFKSDGPDSYGLRKYVKGATSDY